MPETAKDKTVFTLFEVTRSIQKTIAERYKKAYWIKAEMNKLNYFPKSGHCYPDLVEKLNGKVIAEMRCILWKDDYININAAFVRILKEPLRDGIKILFLATIGFQPEHGLTLRIIDIDPGFTLGDLEKEKLEAIKRLQHQGIFKNNKLLQLPLLTQRIAIISVNTSRGYQDFLGKIENNPWGYKFFHLLFPSVLQGDKVVEQMTAQLNRIIKVRTHFDAVAIIRGGGGEVGLSSFNNYEFAKAIALFPLPVLSGIGHITNDTVVEMVSHKSFITPTDLANFLFQQCHNFSVPLQKGWEKIKDKSSTLLAGEKTKLRSEVKLFRSVTGNILLENTNEIKVHVQSLFQQAFFIFKNQKEYLLASREEIRKGTIISCNAATQEVSQFALTIKKDVVVQLWHYKLLVNQQAQNMVKGSKVLLQSGNEKMFHEKEKWADKLLTFIKDENVALDNLEKNVQNMSPLNVLRRGYSLTLLNGKSVKNLDKVKVGDTLNTLLFEGNITSIVNATEKTEEA